MKMTLLVENCMFKNSLQCLGFLTLFFFPGISFAQNGKSPHVINGRVVDPSNRQGIPPASIKIKGSDQGTITDSSGNFSLQANEEIILVFSHIGYDPVEMPVKNRPNRLIAYNNLDLSGGNEDVKSFASAGYTTEAGMWTPTHLKKYNGTLSVIAKATKTTTIGVSLNGLWPGYIGMVDVEKPRALEISFMV